MRELLIIMKALSDESRLRTLLFLRQGELCLCQIIELLELAPSTVSKHMTILRQARLVDSRKEGRWHYYTLADKQAPRAARLALKWTQHVMADDPAMAAEEKLLRRVLRQNKADLCGHYRTS